MSSIFLSHSHKDKGFARKLSEKLRAHGIRTWIDEAEMLVGDSLIMKIEKAIQDFSYLGVILSPDSVSSEWVHREVSIALTQEIQGRRVKVLPILYKKCDIPGFLITKIYVDLSENFEEGFQKLLFRLRSDLHEEQHKQKRAYEIFQSAYQDWISFGKRDHHLLKEDNTTLVMQNIENIKLSIDLLEYIFCGLSILYRPTDEHINRFKFWIDGLCQNEFDDLLERVLNHSNFRVRLGAVKIIRRLNEVRAIDKIITRIVGESNRVAKVEYLRTVYHFGVYLPEELGYSILETDKDWQVQSYALLSTKERKTCLLVSDGTEFAAELGGMAQGAGFRTVVLSTLPSFQSLDEIEDNILQAYEMILLIRGEHFSQGMNNKFYKILARFVSQGGILFATSWVGWETSNLYWFVNILPFIHIRDTYNENVFVNCRSTDNKISQRIFPKNIAYRTSFELLYPKGDAIVLLETEEKIPIFGYHRFGKGICYYFNTCQHFCLDSMPSPFKDNTDLLACFIKVFEWIYDTSKHTI